MTKHVIALKGEEDSGKTQTLLKLINMLYEGAHLSDRVKPFNVDEKGVKDAINLDQQVVIDYKGVKIAICTCGDNKEILQNNIDYFKKNDCDIAVSATRSKGETIKKILEFSNEEKANLHLVYKGWVEYPYLSNNLRQQEACDLLIESTAQAMMIIIDGLIDEINAKQGI